MKLENISEKVKRGVDFMKAGHAGQTRKDGKREYAIHPYEVASIVASITDEEDIIIAALEHDVFEHILEKVEPAHPEYDLIRIRAEFGDRVASLVDDVTDRYSKELYPQGNRKERKQLERQRYATIHDDSKLIKLADICANLADDGGTLPESFGNPDVNFNRMYLWEKKQCLPFLEVKDDPRNVILYAKAQEIWARQAAKFHVR